MCAIDPFHYGYTQYERQMHALPHRTNDIEIYFNYWQQRHALFDTLVQNGFAPLLLDRSVSFLSGLDISHYSGYFQQHSELKQNVLRFTTAGLFTMLHAWREESYRAQPARLAQMAVELLAHPFFINDSK